MQLERAYLCLEEDCQWVGENASFCERCLSFAIFPIHLWLNKTLVTPRDYEVRELEKLVRL